MLKPNGFLHVSLITELPPGSQPLYGASSVFSHTAIQPHGGRGGPDGTWAHSYALSVTEKRVYPGPVHPREAQAGLLSPTFSIRWN